MSRFCFSDRRRKNLKATILLLSCQFLLLAARGPHKTCISATVQLHQRSEFVIFQWKRQQQFISPSQLKAEIDLYKKIFTLLLRNQCETDCDFFTNSEQAALHVTQRNTTTKVWTQDQERVGQHHVWLSNSCCIISNKKCLYKSQWQRLCFTLLWSKIVWA